MKRLLKLDRINQRILSSLQENARISNIDLAEKVGLSPSACLQRAKALEEAGYIHSYLGVVNLDKVCVNVMAYVEITMKTHDQLILKEFERHIKDIPHIVDCMRLAGSIDYLAFVVASTVPDLNQLCNQLLEQCGHIDKMNTHIVMSKPKWLAGYPLAELAWRTEVEGES